MNQKELILHQQIAVYWHNKYIKRPEFYQRLICQWNNAPNKAYGAKMRTMGVKKGVADWQFLIPGSTIWIELKIGDNTQTPEQVAFENLCNLLGHEYIICRSFVHFLEIIDTK